MRYNVYKYIINYTKLLRAVQRFLKKLLFNTLKTCIKLIYRIEIQGLEHFEKVKDKKLVVIANHESFLDAALITLFLPGKLAFAMKPEQMAKLIFKPFLKFFKAIPLSYTTFHTLKTMIQHVKDGDRLVIFPEGRLTTTGALMKVYPGAAMVAHKADAHILPIRIENAVQTKLSVFKQAQRLFPKIKLYIRPAEKFEVSKDLLPKDRREKLGNMLYSTMCDMIFETNLQNAKPLFEDLIAASKRFGKKHLILESHERKRISYKKAIRGALALSYFLPDEEKVGMLLPTTIPAALLFFGMQRKGIVPVMLNYGTGLNNILSACKTSEIKTIFTSRQFLEQLKIDPEAFSDYKLVCLEDLKIGLFTKIKAVAYSMVPMIFTKKINIDDAAVMLFTSGSEGAPKGVVLSHRNIQANRYQIMARYDFNQLDRIFNAMPIFHTFGLTCGTIMPMLSGVKAFMFPNPLHFRLIPELIYDSNSTILFSTNSFLRGFAKYAHPYDFFSIRYIFAGAEKLQDETRETYRDKFGRAIYDGYGTTETSPILTANTLMYHKIGTVGRLLPGISYKIEPVEGIEHGGILHVKGPNIMKGYVKADTPGKIQPPSKGWYNTGDIVEVDEDGYVKIIGRYKRFAKIGGEMIDLTFVEEILAKLWPDDEHAVINKHERLGETLHLFTTKQNAQIRDLAELIRDNHYSNLMIPKTVHVIEKMPKLGTGKVDYVKLGAMI